MNTNEVVALATRASAMGCLVTVALGTAGWLLFGGLGAAVVAAVLVLSAAVTVVWVPRVRFRPTEQDPQHADDWGDL